MIEKRLRVYRARLALLVLAALTIFLGTSTPSFSGDQTVERLAIYQLDPKTETSAEDADLTNAQVFHGSTILRRVVIRDAKLAMRLHSLVDDARNSGKMPSVREGDIGVRFLDRKAPDVIICFYCRPVRVRISIGGMRSEQQILISRDTSRDIECLKTLVEK